jgi:hypothetical protein
MTEVDLVCQAAGAIKLKVRMRALNERLGGTAARLTPSTEKII